MNTKNYCALSAVICACISLTSKNKIAEHPPFALKPNVTKTKKAEAVKKQTLEAKPEKNKAVKSKEAKIEMKKITRTVTINNAVTDDMTCYTKLNQKYKPDSFAIRVNGKPLSKGENTKISITNDKIDVEYDFSFARGWYKGTRKESFKLNSKTDSTKLTFAWNDEHRISLAGAKVDTLS